MAAVTVLTDADIREFEELEFTVKTAVTPFLADDVLIIHGKVGLVDAFAKLFSVVSGAGENKVYGAKATRNMCWAALILGFFGGNFSIVRWAKNQMQRGQAIDVYNVPLLAV